MAQIQQSPDAVAALAAAASPVKDPKVMVVILGLSALPEAFLLASTIIQAGRYQVAKVLVLGLDLNSYHGRDLKAKAARGQGVLSSGTSEA